MELYSICWNITNKCNENCKFCYRKMVKDNTLQDNKTIFDKLSTNHALKVRGLD